MEVAQKSSAQTVHRTWLTGGREASGTLETASAAGDLSEKVMKLESFPLYLCAATMGKVSRLLCLYKRYALRTRFTVKSCARSKASSSSRRCSATSRADRKSTRLNSSHV